jgi:hypothetical protein
VPTYLLTIDLLTPTQYHLDLALQSAQERATALGVAVAVVAVTRFPSGLRREDSLWVEP